MIQKYVIDYKEKDPIRKHFIFAHMNGSNYFHIKVSPALSPYYLHQEMALCKDEENWKASESFVT